MNIPSLEIHLRHAEVNSTKRTTANERQRKFFVRDRTSFFNEMSSDLKLMSGISAEMRCLSGPMQQYVSAAPTSTPVDAADAGGTVAPIHDLQSVSQRRLRHRLHDELKVIHHGCCCMHSSQRSRGVAHGRLAAVVNIKSQKRR